MTVSEQLNNMNEEIKALFKELLLTYSKIYLWNTVDSRIFDMSGNSRWEELSKEGKQLQSKLKNKYTKYFSIINNLLKNQPEVSTNVLFESNKLIVPLIEQNGSTWENNTHDSFDKACRSLDAIIQLIENIYSDNDKFLLVPDTNALLINSRLENWCFNDFTTFTLILTPTILSELDSLKINHRNEEIRNKSISIINQIKDYRRRGSLTESVPIKKNKIYLQTLAIEPNFQDSLPWLDENNNDDRFLSSVLEVMRQNIRSTVYLVTSDINLQNKAEYSMIPFIEPPDLKT